MVEILSLEKAGRWNEIIRSMKFHDFYYLSEYHALDHSGTPLLFYYDREGGAFAFPFIVRPIEGTEYFDITSVYGYCGPLANVRNPERSLIDDFQKELLCFFDSRKVVSAFSRLHPLFSEQQQFLSGLGEVVDLNTTVCIDLNLPDAIQRSHYSHSLKNDINRLNKNGVVVRFATGKNDIDAFIAIYEENMKRVGASRFYYFSQDYFYQFLNTIHSKLLLAFKDGKILGGSIITLCDDIMQVHLSATKNEYLSESPMKIIWDEARKTGIRNQMKFVHLGGGFGGENDSLFLFKTQFSTLYFVFSAWKYIHNEEIYEDLIFKKYKGRMLKDSFFPAYRE